MEQGSKFLLKKQVRVIPTAVSLHPCISLACQNRGQLQDLRLGSATCNDLNEFSFADSMTLCNRVTALEAEFRTDYNLAPIEEVDDFQTAMDTISLHNLQQQITDLAQQVATLTTLITQQQQHHQEIDIPLEYPVPE